MADLKKAQQGVWFGNVFVAAGTVLPATHQYASHPDFVDYEVSDPAVPSEAEVVDELDTLRAEATEAGVKVDKRWGADRLRDELAAAQAAAAEAEEEYEDEEAE